MNALDALILPGVSDSTHADDRKGVAVRTKIGIRLKRKYRQGVYKLTGKIPAVVRGYDQVDGNSEPAATWASIKLGYQILDMSGSSALGSKWTIRFDRMPAKRRRSVFVYADGSQSGATGETIFNYIVTNHVDGDDFGEGFLDPSQLADRGIYDLRVFAADFFGNIVEQGF